MIKHNPAQSNVKAKGRQAAKKIVATTVARPKAQKTGKSAERRPASAQGAGDSKLGRCLVLLRRAQGATLAELQKATSWQAHSVRGFLSGQIKKKLGHKLESKTSDERGRFYRISR